VAAESLRLPCKRLSRFSSEAALQTVRPDLDLRRVRRSAGTKLTAWALAVGLASGLITSACGGDEAGPTGEEDAQTKEEFVAEATRICQGFARDLRAETQAYFADVPLRNKPTRQQLTELFKITVPAIREALRDLRRLAPPEEDRDRFRGVLDDLDAALNRFEDDPSRLYLLYVRGENPYEDVEHGFAALGLGECADG